MSFLHEAFRQLNMLNEEKFSLDDNSAEELLDINDNSDDVEEVVSIADLDAETPEDIESKDYSGKIIVQCPVCLNDMYKDISELEAEENEDGIYETVEEEECPFCSTTGKLLVVAKTVPFEGDDEVEIKVTPKEKEVMDKSNKYCDDKEDCDEEDDDSDDSLDEDLNNIELDTASDHISISSTPKDSEEGNMLGELSDEDFAQMTPEERLNDEEFEDDEATENEEEATDDEVEDFDEESFDSANESLLRREYSNVKSYKTSNVFELNNNLIVEGVVTFRNGNSYKTTYRFKPSSVTSRNSLKLIGENFELAPRKKAFRINGNLFKDRTSNKICEGLVKCGRKLSEGVVKNNTLTEKTSRQLYMKADSVRNNPEKAKKLINKANKKAKKEKVKAEKGMSSDDKQAKYEKAEQALTKHSEAITDIIRKLEKVYKNDKQMFLTNAVADVKQYLTKLYKNNFDNLDRAAYIDLQDTANVAIKRVMRSDDMADPVKIFKESIARRPMRNRKLKESLVDTFLKYHDDADNYHNNRYAFNKLYSILNKYAHEDENPDSMDVDVLFKRAPEDKQMYMLNLIKPRDME